jgi:peptidoglycan/LPS O-acetylase OafA/YrhL
MSAIFTLSRLCVSKNGLIELSFHPRQIARSDEMTKTADPTKLQAREPGLDLLRATAIVSVLFYHYGLFSDQVPLSLLSRYGWLGVDLFFVLSGFLIGSQLFRPLAQGRKIALGRFYMRRFFRTLPAFWVVLILYLTIPAFLERSKLPPLWRLLTFTQNFGLSGHMGFSHAWSLCVEEQFYLILPALILIVAPWATPKRLIALGTALFAGEIGLRWMIWRNFMEPARAAGDLSAASYFHQILIYYPTYSRLDGLLAGVAVAVVAVFRTELWNKTLAKGHWFSAVGALFFGASIFFQDTHHGFTDTVFVYSLTSIAFACFLIAVQSPNIFLSRVSIPGVQFMAALAYSTYLVHKQIMHLVVEFLKLRGWNPGGVPCFSMAVLCSLIAGWILYSLIEKPFLKLRDRVESFFQLKSPFNAPQNMERVESLSN